MRYLIVLATLAAFPLTMAAQQGAPIQSGDIERLNPARVLLDLRKQLRLSRPQVDSLDKIRQAFDRDGKALADTVKRSQRAITTAPPLLRRPPEGRPETRKDSLERAKLDSTNRVKRDRYFDQVTTGRRDLAEALLSLKALFDSTADRTTAILTPDQETGGTLALERASEAFTRRLRLANVR
jgi:hypothetical protein